MNEQEYKFVVVKNHEEQYSIWPSFKDVPNGWIVIRHADTKENCLAYITEVWKDMRPKSLRAQIQNQ